MRPLIRGKLNVGLLALFTLSLLGVSLGSANSRIVAIGDVHGDLEDLTAMLQRTGMIDASGRWTGGSGRFVQTGDLLDRGPSDRGVLELMMRLQKEAPKGKVITLLGNHEVMNMVGDLRYVNPQVFASFADSKSERRRVRAWRQYRRFMRRQAERYQLPLESIALPEAEWLEQHPPGYFEHRDAFAPRGRYGRWLRKQSFVFQLDGLLFVHGGITEQLPDTIDGINRRLSGEIYQFDALRAYLVNSQIILSFFDWKESFAAVQRELEFQRARQPANSPPPPDSSQQRHLELLEGYLRSEGWFIHHPLGPLWNRSLALQPEDDFTRERVKSLMQRYGATHIIVGHTPQLGGIRSRFEGRVLLIDTGMLKSAYPGGTPSALEIKGDRFKAIYPSREEAL